MVEAIVCVSVSAVLRTQLAWVHFNALWYHEQVSTDISNIINVLYYRIWSNKKNLMNSNPHPWI